MKKLLVFILGIFIFLLSGCSDDPATQNELSDINSLSKKGDNTPPPPPIITVPLDLSAPDLLASCSIGDIFKVYSITGGVYTNIWAVKKPYPEGAAIGDFDNDGMKELLGIMRYNTGSGKNAVRHYDLLIFRNGSMGEPAVTIPLNFTGNNLVAGIFAADLDGDSYDEVIILYRSSVQVMKWSNETGTLTLIWENSGSFVYVFDGDVNDIDGDGDKDILCASMGEGNFTIFLNDGSCSFSSPLTSPKIDGTVDEAKICGDVDLDGKTEIIGGGTNCKLNIWKYDPADKSIVLAPETSPTLESYTLGFAAGDFDNDGIIELAAGISGGTSKAYVYKYSNRILTQIARISVPLQGGVTAMAAGKQNELICGGGGGIVVYNNFVQTFIDIWNQEIQQLFVY